MTAWWQRPAPEKPAWRTRGGHDYRVGDPFGFDALGEGRWAMAATTHSTPAGSVSNNG